MNNRLKAVYALIPEGKGVIDVGTDHGYIPAELASCGYLGKIIASDINEGPLLTAKQTAESADVGDRIEFLLCDGLELCDKTAVDTILIAGMGGDTICGILDRADWCESSDYKLILQPMTKAEVLRFWLINNGFSIEAEKLVKDSGIIYQIISARFGETQEYSDWELYTGCYELIKNDPLFSEFLDLLISRFNTAITGMKKADCKNTERLKLYTSVLSGLYKAREYYD